MYFFVIPMKMGIYGNKLRDSRFRGNDTNNS